MFQTVYKRTVCEHVVYSSMLNIRDLPIYWPGRYLGLTDISVSASVGVDKTLLYSSRIQTIFARKHNEALQSSEPPFRVYIFLLQLNGVFCSHLGNLYSALCSLCSMAFTAVSTSNKALCTKLTVHLWLQLVYSCWLKSHAYEMDCYLVITIIMKAYNDIYFITCIALFIVQMDDFKVH